MAENIKVIIRERRAQVDGGPVIVCGNSDYTITFDFDSDWNLTGPKTARFVYVKDGEVLHEDKVFSGKTVAVPVLSDVSFVDVGVFAGDLCTTTPARIRCKKSILCGSGEVHEPTPDVYAQIMALFNEMAEQGAFGATEAQAQQIEANKTNIAKLTNGTTPAGKATDANKLGGETAEAWQTKLDKIRQSVSADLSTEGWYRLTVPNSSTYGSFILSFYNAYNHSTTQSFTLMFEGDYQSGKFCLLGSKQGNTTNVDKIRLVKEDGKFVVDIHYVKNGKNSCYFAFNRLIGGWSLADALTLVETEPAEDNVLTTYVIPSNAQPVLDTEVGTFIDEKTQSIKTTTSKSLTTKGWYRIASGARVDSTTVITLTNPYTSMGADVTTLLYQCSFSGATYTNPQIILFGSMSANQKIFTDIRVVKTSDGIGVDVYYNQNVSNNCRFGLLNLYSQGSWRACDVAPIENTPEEAEIVIQYNIPKNAQPILNTELAEMLANYLPLSGGKISVLDNTPLKIENTNTAAVSAYIEYLVAGASQGKIGFYNAVPWVASKGAIHGDWNSAKVAIQSTAPPDGVWIW